MILFPATILQLANVPVLNAISDLLTPVSARYKALFVFFIVFFGYFYTAVTFNPEDVARTSRSTADSSRAPTRQEDREYIDKVVTRITFGGAVYVPASACCRTS